MVDQCDSVLQWWATSSLVYHAFHSSIRRRRECECVFKFERRGLEWNNRRNDFFLSVAGILRRNMSHHSHSQCVFIFLTKDELFPMWCSTRFHFNDLQAQEKKFSVPLHAAHVSRGCGVCREFIHPRCGQSSFLFRCAVISLSCLNVGRVSVFLIHCKHRFRSRSRVVDSYSSLKENLRSSSTVSLYYTSCRYFRRPGAECGPKDETMTDRSGTLPLRMEDSYASSGLGTTYTSYSTPNQRGYEKRNLVNERERQDRLMRAAKNSAKAKVVLRRTGGGRKPSSSAVGTRESASGRYSTRVFDGVLEDELFEHDESGALFEFEGEFLERGAIGSSRFTGVSDETGVARTGGACSTLSDGTNGQASLVRAPIRIQQPKKRTIDERIRSPTPRREPGAERPSLVLVHQDQNEGARGTQVKDNSTCDNKQQHGIVGHDHDAEKSKKDNEKEKVLKHLDEEPPPDEITRHIVVRRVATSTHPTCPSFCGWYSDATDSRFCVCGYDCHGRNFMPTPAPNTGTKLGRVICLLQFAIIPWIALFIYVTLKEPRGRDGPMRRPRHRGGGKR